MIASNPPITSIRRRAVVRRSSLGVALLFACVVLGCASARWSVRNQAAGYALPSPIALYLDVSDQVAVADDAGFVLTLLDTLEGELHGRGIATELVTPSKAARPVPRIDIFVRNADEGSRLVRYMTGFAGSPSIVVECVVFSADNRPKFAGRLEGTLIGTGHEGDPGGDPRVAAIVVGRAIAEAITAYN